MRVDMMIFGGFAVLASCQRIIWRGDCAPAAAATSATNDSAVVRTTLLMYAVNKWPAYPPMGADPCNVTLINNGL